MKIKIYILLSLIILLVSCSTEPTGTDYSNPVQYELFQDSNQVVMIYTANADSSCLFWDTTGSMQILSYGDQNSDVFLGTCSTFQVFISPNQDPMNCPKNTLMFFDLYSQYANVIPPNSCFTQHSCSADTSGYVNLKIDNGYIQIKVDSIIDNNRIYFKYLYYLF